MVMGSGGRPQGLHMLPILEAHLAPPPSGPGGRSWLPLHSQHFLSGGPSVDRGAGHCGLGWADSMAPLSPRKAEPLHLSKPQRPAWSAPPGPCPRGLPQANWGVMGLVAAMEGAGLG